MDKKIRSTVNYEGNMLIYHALDSELVHDLVVGPDEQIIRDYVWKTRPYWDL